MDDCKQYLNSRMYLYREQTINLYLMEHMEFTTYSDFFLTFIQIFVLLKINNMTFYYQTRKSIMKSECVDYVYLFF